MTERVGPSKGAINSAPPVSSAPVRGLEIIAIGLWFGIASGILIAGVQIVRRVALGRLVWHSQDLVWMTPLAQVVLLGAVSLGFAGLAMLSGRPGIRTAAVGTLGFLGAFSVLLLFVAMARWASALLALGVAVQASRLDGAAPERWRRRFNRSLLVMVLLIAGLGAGVRIADAIQRERSRASLPPPPAGSPNVLLVILDTVRRDHLSLYGYPRPTTTSLERWAAEAAVFERALATAPWTLPSHGALFTGQLGSKLGGDWKVPVPRSPTTLAEVLRTQGYATGGFVANLLYVSRESGLTGGFIDYLDYPVTGRQIVLHSPIVQTPLFRNLIGARSIGRMARALRRFDLVTSRVPADEYRPATAITDAFLAWQAKLGGRPFFGVLNYFDAHGPYRAPESVLGRFGPTETPVNRYDGAIGYLDAELDRMFGELGRRGALDRTVVVVTSDHGELFGEHGLTGHANGLYLPLLRVPLIIRYPARVSPRRIVEVVSLRDVPNTILELVGVEASNDLGTGSLAGLLGLEGSHGPSAVVAELIRGFNVNPKSKNAQTWLQSTTDEDHHYIRNGLGEEELYRWSSDSLELTNLADRPESAPVLGRLRARLNSLVGRLD